MTMETKICPKCKSNDVIPIVYGMPTEELFEESKKGNFLLGGCCIDDSAQWHCKKCDYEWGTTK